MLPWEVDVGIRPISNGLGPGDFFRLIYVSANLPHCIDFEASSKRISDYTDFLQNESRGIVFSSSDSGICLFAFRFPLPTISLPLFDAREVSDTTFTNNDKSVPICWVLGGKFADDEDFCDGDWDDETNLRDASGNIVTDTSGIWTASATDGTELIVSGASHAMGEASVGCGSPGSTTPGAGSIRSGSTAANTEERRLYGLSQVFKLVSAVQVTNLGQSGKTENYRSARRSQRFTTGANLHGYEDIGIQFAYNRIENREGYSLANYAVDGSGHPDTEFAAKTYPDADSGFELTFDSLVETVLDPNATHSLVVTPDTADQDVNLDTTSSDTEDSETKKGWSIADSFDIKSGGSRSADSLGRSLRIRVRATLKVGPPADPTSLTATATGRNRVNLMWTAPTKDGGSGIPQTVTFDSGETEKTFTFTALNDKENDDNTEGVKLKFGTLPSMVIVGTPSETTINISDVSLVAVSFHASAVTVPEGEGILIGVSMSDDPERTAVIPIETPHLNGISNDDYRLGKNRLTLLPCVTSRSFYVFTTQDYIDDDDESVRIEFGTLPHNDVPDSPTSLTMTIIDDEEPADVTYDLGRAYAV